MHPSTELCQVDDFDLGSFAGVASSFGQERYSYVVTPNTLHRDFVIRAARRARISSNSKPLVCSEVMAELLMTLAPRAIINGATARWLLRRLRSFSELFFCWFGWRSLVPCDFTSRTARGDLRSHRDCLRRRARICSGIGDCRICLRQRLECF